jgi:hypothetical protein
MKGAHPCASMITLNHASTIAEIRNQVQRGLVCAVDFEQADKCVFGQQPHVFGKHAEQTAG